MKPLLSFMLIVGGWTLCQGQMRGDQIFFSDNLPRIPTKKPAIIERVTDVTIEKSVQTQNQEDTYSQAAKGTQSYAPYSLETLYQNLGNLNTLSSNLQPPNNRNSANYYAEYRNNETTKKPVKNEIHNQEQDLVSVLPTVPELNNISLALINFGVKMLKNINHGGRNVVLSPFSIAELLALLQQGALGQTQQQISQALEMSPSLSATAFRNINERLQKRESRNILRVANNVYVADAFALNPAFKRIAVESFGSEVTPLSFQSSPNAAQEINEWVSQKTSGKIPELLAPDALGENTQLVLVNAVYFKGLWSLRFKPESTSSKDFYMNEVTKKTTPFMHIRKIFRSGVDPTNNAQIIILPFENEQYSMMLVVPSPVSSLDAFVATMTNAQLAAYHTFTPKEVDLEVPKFTVRADTDLSQILQKMGVTNVFTRNSDLSGLGTFRAFSPQLSSALHSAMLSIDEDGGSAAGATSFAVVALSYDEPSLVIKANRPFLAVLWDQETSAPLFMARIQDPTP